MDSNTFAIATSAIASFAMAALMVLTSATHGRFTMDAPGAIQKFHLAPTPRIGGIGIYLAVLAASPFVPQPDASHILTTILIAGVPALFVGLLEDLTKRVGVSARLVATMASGCLACWFSGIAVTHVDFVLADRALQFLPVAVLFTSFAIAGVANAVNIIDGFHGLASGTSTLCLLAIAVIAAMVGDSALVIIAVVVAAAVAGFWLVNFPWGKLFLGDGGAYFAGFALAWLAVLLPARNPAVSPWASLLVCGYPTIEVLYSIVRRRWSAGTPDRRHLHSLVATQLVQPRLQGLHPALQNSAVSVIMWVAAAIPAAAALAFFHRTDMLVMSFLSCALAYHLAYRRLARP